MRTLVYDGSFEGLLSAVFICFRDKLESVNIIRENSYIPDLFCDEVLIQTNRRFSLRVLNGIKKNISVDAVSGILHAFLTEKEGVENLILGYLQYGFKNGYKSAEHLTNNFVLKIEKLANSIKLEVHRFMGLVRFQELIDGTFYAAIEPDYNILSLLGSHFSQRFADQDWVIHDLKRGDALMFKNSELEMVCITKIGDSGINRNLLSDNEVLYSEIWRNYCKYIGIKERKNLKLQMQFMPKKYWKHLTEIK